MQPKNNIQSQIHFGSIIYLGYAAPEDIENEVGRVDSVQHVATNKFAWTIIRSLAAKFDFVANISSCDIRNYPAGNKLFFYSQRFVRQNVSGIFIGFINIIVIKHLSRFLILLRFLPSVLIGRRMRYMIVHGSHTPFMLSAILCKFFIGLRIAIILTDQHGLDVASDGWFGRFARGIDKKLMRLFLNRFDGFICLSPRFVDEFKLRNYLLVPGILSSDFNSSVVEVGKNLASNELFVVVFAGGVSIENGIDKLIEAFAQLKYNHARLVVYGVGPLVNMVQKHARTDSRVRYGGFLQGDMLTKAMLAANLLVNPRPANVEYAKNSFPSKLIEYMGTGIPTLTTRQISIPAELKDCLYYIEDIEGIADALERVLEIPAKDRLILGRLARMRVSELYSEEVFSQRVYSLFQMISRGA